jgi:hypothetical protein
LVLFALNSQKYQEGQAGQQELPVQLVVLVSAGILLCANLSFVLAQLMNPGILNPSSIPQELF